MHAEQVARATAQKQGLPDTITDVWALAQIAHFVVNAETVGAANPDRSNHEPDTARAPKRTAVSGVDRAA